MRKFTLIFMAVGAMALGVWGWNSRHYHEVVPMRLNRSNVPVIDVTISSCRYPVFVDLGSKVEMSLQKGIVQDLGLQQYGRETWSTLKKSYNESSRYKLLSVLLGSIPLRHVYVVEMNEGTQTILWKDPHVDSLSRATFVGHIGRPLLVRKNLLLDCKKNRLIFSNSTRRLKKSGYDLSSYLKVPIEVSSKGVFITIELDDGPLRFLVDTGCTRTFLSKGFLFEEQAETEKGFSISHSEAFLIGGHNFGPMKIFYYDFPSHFGFMDGCLGMDFFLKHVVYLDFSSQCAYIGLQ